jgi:DDE superfamily endonuclease
MVVICADETTLSPTIIFKGKAVQSEWIKMNPLKSACVLLLSSRATLTHLTCRVCISDKGWTDQEIAFQWLQNFNETTAEKAGSQPQLLLLDGHNSHYGLEFIHYAKEHNITVMCYPAHCTHVLQGLDVVTFAALKHWYTKLRDAWNEKNSPT